MSVDHGTEADAFPSTPHELHALGLLSLPDAGRLIGYGPTTMKERTASGEIPSVNALGIRRIEPLVAWAARKGGNRETLHAVARALLEGSSVDEIVRLVQELIEAQPPPVRKRRGVKKAVTP